MRDSLFFIMLLRVAVLLPYEFVRCALCACNRINITALCRLYSKKQKLAAFSLIEVAISLIIMGLIASFTIPLITTHFRLSQQKKTELHQEQIVAALAAYVLKNHKLPVPASTSQGVAAHKCQTEMPENCKGYVPFATLGLPEKVAKDGYGNWFTYVVHPQLTGSAIPDVIYSDPFCSTIRNFITLRNAHTNQVVSKTKDDPIAFILISHGKNGSGALTDLGDRIPATGLEFQNSQTTFDFVEGVSPNFDHQIYWVTRDNFMAFHAKKPCQKSLERSHGEQLRRTPATHESTSKFAGVLGDD